MSTTIQIRNLTKKYPGSERAALTGLSLEVNAGEVYGFLGPNGAGKSTTIRLLLNFIQPSAGSATILGRDIVSDALEIRRTIGYVTGDSSLYPKLTGQQFLDYMGELQAPKSAHYVNELGRRLKADLHVKLGTLSRGNKQKIALIAAFMHQPKIMILDEPSTGLDPLMQEEFYMLVAEARQRGATIFTSSHILSEVQKICDRVGIIRSGKLIDELTIAKMAEQASQTFDIVFANTAPIVKLRKLSSVQKITASDEKTVSLHIKGELNELFSLLATTKVHHISTRELNLEDEFLKYYQSEVAHA